MHYLTSQMLSALIDLNRTIGTLDGQLILLGLRPRLRELFRITGIDRLFTFAPTEKDALRVFDVACV